MFTVGAFFGDYVDLSDGNSFLLTTISYTMMLDISFSNLLLPPRYIFHQVLRKVIANGIELKQMASK